MYCSSSDLEFDFTKYFFRETIPGFSHSTRCGKVLKNASTLKKFREINSFEFTYNFFRKNVDFMEIGKSIDFSVKIVIAF